MDDNNCRTFSSFGRTMSDVRPLFWALYIWLYFTTYFLLPIFYYLFFRVLLLIIAFGQWNQMIRNSQVCLATEGDIIIQLHISREEKIIFLHIFNFVVKKVKVNLSSIFCLPAFVRKKLLSLAQNSLKKRC